MKTLYFTLLSLFIITQASAQSGEEKAIRDSFTKYKEAILGQNGTAAIQYVDNNTKMYYSRMLNYAKSMDSVELSAQPMMDIITVLTCRQRFSPEQIRRMEGDDFFVQAVNNGMIDKNGTSVLDLGEVIVDGASASAQITQKGSGTGMNFRFFKESGQWKVDLTSLLPSTGKQLNRMRLQQGMQKAQFASYIAGLIDSSKGQKNDLWRPVY